VKKSKDQNSLVRLRLAGAGSFYADEAWREKIVGDKTCPHCRSVFSGTRSLDVLVDNKKHRRTDVDLLDPFIHRVCIFSLKLIGLVGGDQVNRVAGLGRVLDVKGFEHEGHRSAVAIDDSLVVRGNDPSSAALCKECGRLLCGAAGEQYVLRCDIPSEPFFLSDGEVFCTEAFWMTHIYEARLTRVVAEELPIREEPEDGLPASTRDLKAFLKRRKIFR
jgi:hypothetical protein